MKTKVNKNGNDDDSSVYRRRVQYFQHNYQLTEEEAASAIALLDAYLPHGYTRIIVQLAKEQGVIITKQVVRLVKLGKTNNPLLFHLLLEFASEQKASELDVRGKIKKNLSGD